MNRKIIHTEKAPKAIGTYSQAVRVENTVYLSGQIPLHPQTMEMVNSDFSAEVHQVFQNLQAVCEAAGSDLNAIVKLNIYLTDLNYFTVVNEIMAEYFSEPYPARAAIGVAALPRNARVEMDGVMVLERGNHE